MPDISKCHGHGCKKKKTCYRYLAKPSYWQSYGDYDSLYECESYWPITGDSKVKKPNPRQKKPK